MSARSVASAGFAFVYMMDKRDGDDAIRALDGCGCPLFLQRPCMRDHVLVGLQSCKLAVIQPSQCWDTLHLLNSKAYPYSACVLHAGPSGAIASGGGSRWNGPGCVTWFHPSQERMLADLHSLVLYVMFPDASGSSHSWVMAPVLTAMIRNQLLRRN